MSPHSFSSACVKSKILKNKATPLQMASFYFFQCHKKYANTNWFLFNRLYTTAQVEELDKWGPYSVWFLKLGKLTFLLQVRLNSVLAKTSGI